MELPKFGMPQNPDPYAIPPPGADKKKLFLMFGGVLALLVLLAFVLLGGGGNEGQTSMRSSLQNTSDSIGILNEYIGDINNTGLQNDLSLSLILLRGNQQSMNDLYKKTFPSARSFPRSPKPDDTSKEKLDAAKRNNVLDSEIITVLREKTQAASRSLAQAKQHFTSSSSREIITNSQEDLDQVYEILDKDR